MTEHYEIRAIGKIDGALENTLLAIWEESVAETHHFLTRQDIEGLKPYVREALHQVSLTAACQGGDTVAFMGLAGDKVEMLFIHPGSRGRGVGRTLLTHAVERLHARRVDVNEQNTQAVGFYQKMGFRVYARSQTDGQGNPFPILHMEI